MGGLLARFSRGPQTPVKFSGRLKNIALVHYRGLLGVLVPLFLLSWQGEKGKHDITVRCMWMMITWFFLLQPVNIPVTGLIPIFALPLGGVMSTVHTVLCYMNDNVLLFVLGSMLLLLLNNTGADRRIALSILCAGKTHSFSAYRMVFKCSTAAFFLSMLCNRLIVTNILIEYVMPFYTNLQASDPSFAALRYVVCNAIYTSSSIGSIVITHASTTTLVFRAIFYTSPPKGKEYPDIFNYFQHTVYAFPVGLMMFIVNCLFNMYLIKLIVKKPLTPSNMSEIQSSLRRHKDALPKKATFHELLSMFFTICYLATFFLRWNKGTLNISWADFRAEASSPEIPGIKDATVASMFVILLHILPKGFGFLKYITAKKKSQLPPIKAESAILWWRFVDQNLNYGYMFLFGCGVAISVSARESGYAADLSKNIGKHITDQDWNVSIFVVCLVAVVLANVMPGIAGCVVWLPFIMNMSREPNAPANWQNKAYLGALGVGVGSSLGFMCPFLNTPAYFAHYKGKVPKKKMAKYAIGSVIICFVILWLSLCFFAPVLWDPKNVGVTYVAAPLLAGQKPTTTTVKGEAPAEGKPAPAPVPDPAPAPA